MSLIKRGAQRGRAYVYHGSASGLETAANRTIESDQTNAELGWSVGAAGDVNGDGYDDVIIGADCYSNGETKEGRAQVHYGSASGLSATPNWTAEGDQGWAYFGLLVGAAGDVNGDGYDDVIVGAPRYDNSQTDEGRAFVYHGSPAGLSAAANWTAESDQADARFCFSVGSVGDVNGDGYDDVIVGAYLYDNGQANEGRAFVYHGSASGLGASAGWTAESNQEIAYLGYSVGAAGDVNGDGYDDVIVGSYLYDSGQAEEGAAFVYYGSGPAYTAQTTTIRYTYDPLQRLTGASYSGAYTYTFAYAYDAVGNRTVQTQTITSTLVTTYTYDAANRLTNVNGQAYTWDNNGNLKSDGSKTYTYTQANRLITVTASGLTWGAAYNGDGARLKQVVNSVPTTYTQDLAAPLVTALTERTGATTKQYLYGLGDSPLAVYSGTTWTYLSGRDGLNSVRQETEYVEATTRSASFPTLEICATMGSVESTSADESR